MNPLRIKHLRKENISVPKKYVIYWMQQAQRVKYNHALEHAISIANRLNLPLLVFFGLTSNYPEANHRHYRFMLEGLKEVKDALNSLGISFVLKYGSPKETILPLLNDANTLVMDKGYLKEPRAWRKSIIAYAIKNELSINIDIVDTDLIVPVEVASNKVEYRAYTLRPKIKKIYRQFIDFSVLTPIKNKKAINIDSSDSLEKLDQTIINLNLAQTLSPSKFYRGGYSQASKLLDDFIEHKLNHYLESSDPSLDYTSKLSMYLHFGQISSLEILNRITIAKDKGEVNKEQYEAFVEQLLIRRELAFNYVYYHQGYDQFETMTEPWAYKTMEEHQNDSRPYIYSREDIEKFKTHDSYFNAAMKEMVITGYMPNYMRMYWAKKIIEWTSTYKKAYETIC